MTLFSYIILIFWISFFLNRDPKKGYMSQLALTLFISIFVEVGLFLDTDLVKVEYWHITTILTFISSLLLLNRITKIRKPLLYYLFTISLGLLILAIFPVDEPCVVGSGGVIEEVIGGEASFKKPMFTKFTVFYFGFALLQAFSIQIAFNKLEIKDYINLIRKLAVGAKFIIVLVLLEIVVRYFSGTIYSDLIADVFGIGPSTQMENYERQGGFLLQGLTREASHLVYSLFSGILILFVDSKFRSKRVVNTAFISIGLIEIGLSMAFTSVLVYSMLLLLYFVYRNYVVREAVPIVRKILLFVVLPIMAVIANAPSLLRDSYFAVRFSSAIDDFTYLLYTNKVNIMTGLEELSSAMARFYSINSSISLLEIRPLFGVGMGTNFSHGSTAWTLGETGVLGLLTYLYFIFFSKPVFNKKSTYMLVILIWLLGNLFVSRPILMVRYDCFLFFVIIYLMWYQSYPKKLKNILC